jgi:hypothetical protein
MATVSSVEKESTTSTSSATSPSAARQRPMLASSLKVMMTTESDTVGIGTNIRLAGQLGGYDG